MTVALALLLAAVSAFAGALGIWVMFRLRGARAEADAHAAIEARRAEVADVHDAAAKRIGAMTPEEVAAHAHQLLENLRARDGGGPSRGPAPGAR